MGALLAMLGFGEEALRKKLREDCALNDEQLETYRMETAFDLLTILKYFHIWKEFCKCLAKDHEKEPDKLELTGEEFLQIPCIAISPLKNQIIRSIPSKNGTGCHVGDIDFSAFMRLTAVTNGDARMADKLKFAFQMYDMDGDGKIEMHDLIQYLTAVTDFDEETKQQQDEYKEFIKKAAKTTFEELGRDDFLRMEDFQKTLLHSDFAHKYVLALPLNNVGDVAKEIEKVKKDLEIEAARLVKAEEVRQARYDATPEGKEATKQKEEEEEKKQKEEEEQKKKDEEKKAKKLAEEKAKKEAKEK